MRINIFSYNHTASGTKFHVWECLLQFWEKELNIKEKKKVQRKNIKTIWNIWTKTDYLRRITSCKQIWLDTGITPMENDMTKDTRVGREEILRVVVLIWHPRRVQ